MQLCALGRLYLATLVVISALFNEVHSFAADVKSPIDSNSARERNEYENLRQRFQDTRNENLLNAAGWTLAHSADEQEVKQVEPVLKDLAIFGRQGSFEQLDRRGGVDVLKNEIAALLQNPDPIVRGFAAVTLSVVGDTNYVKEIAGLLERKPRATDIKNDWSEGFDQSRAAMALGLLGAKTYRVQISELLHSKNSDVRSGAALGLGYMRASGSTDEIAKLLQDEDDQVLIAATQALGELDAKGHIPAVAKLLWGYGDPSVYETAAYVLVRLQAASQIPVLAEFLGDKYKGGCTAKALALLGAKQYTSQIADTLNNQDALLRCDALIALGIMGDTSQSGAVGRLLDDKEIFVRPYAAVALLLMHDRSHSGKIHALLGKDQAAKFFIERSLRFHPVLADRAEKLVDSAVREYQDFR